MKLYECAVKHALQNTYENLTESGKGAVCHHTQVSPIKEVANLSGKLKIYYITSHGKYVSAPTMPPQHAASVSGQLTVSERCESGSESSHEGHRKR